MKTSSRFHYAWVVLAVGTLVGFAVIGMARFGYTVVLPTMQESMGLNNTQTGVLATANMSGYLALSAIGGVLAAHYGPRMVIFAGLVLTGTSMLFTGLADGFLSVMVWRALTGIGSGVSNVAMMGMLMAWFTTRRRGLATGIAVSGTSLGLIFAGPLAPYLLSIYGERGWRVYWVIFGSVTLMLAIVCPFLLRNRPAEIGLNPFGANSEEVVPNPQKETIQWGRVYRSAPVWHLGMVYGAFGFAYVIYMTFFVKHLIAEGGYTREAAGNLFMLMGWCSLLCGIIWGMISDVIGRKRALIMVYLIHTAAFSLFALWPSPIGFSLSSVLFGLSAWSIPAIMAATCGDVLGSRMAPAAIGFITLFLGIGQVLGPSVAGALADATGSFFSAFLLAGAVAFLGAIGAFFLRPASTTKSH